MNRGLSVRALALVLALVGPLAARAADWLAIQGTEIGQPEDPVRVWGFTQLVGEGVLFGKKLEGLESEQLKPFNGKTATFNQVGSGAPYGFAVKRARLGFRGAVPGTDKNVNWMIAGEFGNNQLTRTQAAILTDASVTLNYIPFARVRLGQFKLPTMDETMEANPISGQFINFSLVASQLMLESPIVAGKYTGGVNAFRDVGMEVFDAWQKDRFALSYALALTNGEPQRVEVDGPKDVTGRVMASWIFDGERQDPHREELSLFAWRQQGRRNVDGAGTDRVRQGLGVHYERKKLRVRAEFVDAKGAIELGANPPFAGEPVKVAANGEARGGYLMAHYQLGRFGLSGRYEELWRGLESDAALRITRVGTFGTELQLAPRARLMLNYELRRQSAPHGSPDAQRIAASMGDRLSAQAAITF